MVIPGEYVELDPEPENILSVWGKEISTQNLDLFFRGDSLLKDMKGSADLKILKPNASEGVDLKRNQGLDERRCKEDQARVAEEGQKSEDLSVTHVSTQIDPPGAQFSYGGLEDVVYGQRAKPWAWQTSNSGLKEDLGQVKGGSPQAISRTSLSKNGGTLSELQGIEGSKEQKDGRKGVPSEIAVWQPGKEGTEEGAGEGLSSRKLGEDRLHVEALDLEPDGEKTPFRTSEEAGG